MIKEFISTVICLLIACSLSQASIQKDENTNCILSLEKPVGIIKEQSIVLSPMDMSFLDSDLDSSKLPNPKLPWVVFILISTTTITIMLTIKNS